MTITVFIVITCHCIYLRNKTDVICYAYCNDYYNNYILTCQAIKKQLTNLPEDETLCYNI